MTPTDDKDSKPNDQPDVTDENDTEGHSLLNVELGRAMSADRAREVSKLDRDQARAREAKAKDGGGFFKRLGRR